METVQHGDSWWRQGDDGTWYRWNEATRAWEYAQREEVPGAPPPAADASQPVAPATPYRSPRIAARVVTTLLGAAVVLDAAALVAYLAELRRWNAAVAGSVVADTDVAAGDVRLGLLSAALLVVLLATIPAFIVWFHRLYTNLPALGATELRFTSGWAIGAWFVPFLNLWRPKQIADDIWRASDPDADTVSGPHWRGRPVGGVVHVWWGLYLLSNLVNQAVVRSSIDAEGVQELRTRALADSGAAVLDALAALAALWFVVQLTERHERRAAAVHPT